MAMLIVIFILPVAEPYAQGIRPDIQPFFIKTGRRIRAVKPYWPQADLANVGKFELLDTNTICCFLCASLVTHLFIALAVQIAGTYAQAHTKSPVLVIRIGTIVQHKRHGDIICGQLIF